MKKHRVYDSGSDDLDLGVCRTRDYSISIDEDSKENSYRDVINEWMEQYAPRIIEEWCQQQEESSEASAECVKSESGGKAKLVKTKWFYNPGDINNLKETRK